MKTFFRPRLWAAAGAAVTIAACTTLYVHERSLPPGTSNQPSTAEAIVQDPSGYRAEPPQISHPEDLVRRDFGRGIVHLSASPGERVPRSDTVRIHRSPERTSEVRARFVFDQPDAYGYSYQLLGTQPGLVSNVLEFAYEESGLPVDSLPPGGWLRVVYAVDPEGEPQRGWVEFDPERLSYRSWRDHLPQHYLYFLSPESSQFHSSPEGERLALPLGPLPGDYEMIPVGVEGEWMQVRVRSPSDCTREPGQESTEQLAWIRYLQPDGRPRVWYYARGC